MHRLIPRPAARRAACAAAVIPVLLVAAGCTSDSGADDKPANSPSPSSSAPPAPVKYKELPEPCKTLDKGTIEDLVPGADDKTGKDLASSDTERYGSCLWSGGSGKNDAEYRALTVSLKRYDSDAALGSGDKQAGRFYDQEKKAVASDEANKKVEQSALDGDWEQAVVLSYETEKKKHDYRISRAVVRDGNVVVTVDYEGTGFEGADPPSAKEVRKNAERAAKEAAKALG
ncbi:DUF3558 domain-containing protein [Streptomyces sp. JJ36]|uniref:DUF3558 domain-containing protein n=1 Tax=Streptomyces sp. JJ36 TaxID=2736645 RepID=UPI001F43FD80|nr:DUF3558 domain-containing protein [Streptomyces sp. JJ36]MCF6524726.1 DUF3558 domain-containing protein [Streptomyces sp. JJ36]